MSNTKNCSFCYKNSKFFETWPAYFWGLGPQNFLIIHRANNHLKGFHLNHLSFFYMTSHKGGWQVGSVCATSSSNRNWAIFSINRKFKISEPEVKNIPDRKRIKFQVVSKISVWWYFEQGRRQRLLKIFAPYVLVYGHTRTKMVLVVTRIEISKNEDRTLITKTHELSDEILFDFRFRWLELPVFEK